MKNKLKKLFTSILAVAMLAGATACSVATPPATSEQESIDNSKAQLNVWVYDGGFGSEWLYKAKARYEEIHKNDSYNGKTGIQIKVTAQKTGFTASTVKSNAYDIYFHDAVDYRTFINEDALLDLTDVYTKDNPYETGKKVGDKVYEEMEEYYNYNGKYYAVPHYAGYFGIAYNIELFDEMGYYIRDDADFVNKALDKNFTSNASLKSAGPDGQKGTDDDGLPVTYDDFFFLCEYMKISSTPLIWSGQYADKHLTGLTHALVAQAEGAEQLRLTYTNDGVATTLGKVVNGEFVLDAEPTTITSANGYELARRKGNYEALTFINKLVNQTAGDGEHYWHEQYSFDNGFSHTAAQRAFLSYGYTINTQKKIGMLVDGAWWENEAKDVFADMASSNGDEYSRSNRKIGWMPLPKAEADDNGSTVYSTLQACGFAKSTVEDWKKDVVIDFMQFLNTDESLREFSVTTNTLKAMKYTLTDADKAQLSTYGRSLINYVENSDVVFPYAANSIFVNNQTLFKDDATSGLYQSKIGDNLKQNPARAFKDEPTKYNPANYFDGLYQNMKSKTFWG